MGSILFYKISQELYFKMNLWKDQYILIRDCYLKYQVKIKVKTKCRSSYLSGV